MERYRQSVIGALFALALLWGGGAAEAAITKVDVCPAGCTNSGQNQACGTTTTCDTTFTVSSGVTLLVMTAICQGSGADITGVSATWDTAGVAQALTLEKQQNSVLGNHITALILYRNQPTAGASKTLRLTWTTTADCYVGPVTFSGTDTSTPIVTAHTVGNNTTTATVTTTSGNATVAVAGCACGNVTAFSFTAIWTYSALNPGGGADYTITSGTSDAHAFSFATPTDPSSAGVDILAASAGGTVLPTTLMFFFGVGSVLMVLGLGTLHYHAEVRLRNSRILGTLQLQATLMDRAQGIIPQERALVRIKRHGDA